MQIRTITTPARMLLSVHQLISIGNGTEEMSTCTVLMGMHIGTDIMGSSTEVLRKLKIV